MPKADWAPRTGLADWLLPGRYWKREAVSRELARQAAMSLMAHRIAEVKKTASEEIATERKRITRLLEQASLIRWDRKEGSTYAVTVEMDPRFMALGHPGNEHHREYLAEYLSREVYLQIQSARFVQMAAEERRRLMEAIHPRFTIEGPNV